MAKTVYYAQSETPITAVPADLVIWGPGDPRPTLPIAGWNPATGAWPKPEPTPPPDGIWGAGGPGMPTNPIAEPPWGWGSPPPKPDVPPASGWTVRYGWTASTGWFVFATPNGAVPTPSAKK